MTVSPSAALAKWVIRFSAMTGCHKCGAQHNLTRAAPVEVNPDLRPTMMHEALMPAHADIAWLPLHRPPLSWAARDTVEIPQAADDLVRLWLARVTN